MNAAQPVQRRMRNARPARARVAGGVPLRCRVVAHVARQGAAGSIPPYEGREDDAPWAAGAGGAAFLVWYGLRSFLAAWRGGEALDSSGRARASLRGVLGTVLLLTWLNPHVYLDTVVLLGSISAQYDDRLAFTLGAMSASFVFFFSLGYGARLLAPLFARPAAWRVLDVFVGAVMWAIALKLVW